jgi:hypothetical protein
MATLYERILTRYFEDFTFKSLSNHFLNDVHLPRFLQKYVPKRMPKRMPKFMQIPLLVVMFLTLFTFKEFFLFLLLLILVPTSVSGLLVVNEESGINKYDFLRSLLGLYVISYLIGSHPTLIIAIAPMLVLWMSLIRKDLKL